MPANLYINALQLSVQTTFSNRTVTARYLKARVDDQRPVYPVYPPSTYESKGFQLISTATSSRIGGRREDEPRRRHSAVRPGHSIPGYIHGYCTIDTTGARCPGWLSTRVEPYILQVKRCVGSIQAREDGSFASPCSPSDYGEPSVLAR